MTATLRSPSRSGPLPLVMLLDPSDDDRAMYGVSLRQAGFRVVESAEPEAVLATAPRLRPVAIALELRLRNVDGADIVRLLRAGPRTSDIPLIVLTASMLPPDVRRARDAGCDLFLRKPCLPDDFVREVRRVVDASREVRATSIARRPREDEVRRASDRVLRMSADGHAALQRLLRRRR